MKFLIFFAFIFLVSCTTLPEIQNTDTQESELGKLAFEEILKDEEISKNEKPNTVLNRVGTRIKEANDIPNTEWEFLLFESPNLEAFALPGGKLALTTGLLPHAKNEAGIAVIVSHLMAHVLLHHFTPRLNSFTKNEKEPFDLKKILQGDSDKKRKTLLASLGLGPEVGITLPFSREAETEADTLSLKLLAQAGYDPKEAPLLWERLESVAGHSPDLFSNHPESNKRKFNFDKQIRYVEPFYNASAKYGQGETL